LTGLIYAAIVVVWAIVLVPLALRRHDQAARRHSIERFSSAMRVLARRGPASESGSIGPVPDQLVHPSLRHAETGAPGASVAPPRRPSRAAMKAAAARRRRVLTILLAATVLVAGVSAFGLLPWYAAAVPFALVVAFLWVARRQVRKASDSFWQQVAEMRPEPSNVVRREGHSGAARVDASEGVVRVSTPDERHEDRDEDTVGMSREELAAASSATRVEAVALATSDGGSLWDPLPVTLPTYVEKPAAARTVRTIELGEPGTWSAGHSAADSKTVATAEAAEDTASAAEQRRAANA
jgi:hypothetical protein